MVPIIKVLREENTSVIFPLMIYENRKNTIFKLLISVVYSIMDNYLCANHLCFQKARLHFSNKGFENTTFNDISGIIIPELLMNIISCHGFVND